MRAAHQPSRFSFSAAIFNLLDPIPFGMFVGGLIFDVIYFKTGYMLWVKGAAWLISIGLVFAIIPQLINLAVVWFSKHRVRSGGQVINFWLNVVAIIAALFNAFVHSRDAFAVMPDGMWLSVLTVLAMGLGRLMVAGERVVYTEVNHG